MFLAHAWQPRFGVSLILSGCATGEGKATRAFRRSSSRTKRKAESGGNPCSIMILVRQIAGDQVDLQMVIPAMDSHGL